MRKHPIRKFIGLTVLYAVVIVGIFVLQFKTESVLSIGVGSMQITLAQTQTENNELKLKNQLQVVFRGFTFTANENSPAIVSNSKENGKSQNLVLESYTHDDLNTTFNFKDGTKITFTVTDETPQALIHIAATPSQGYDTVSIPYTISSTYSIMETNSSRFILENKGEYFSLSSSAINSKNLVLTSTQDTETAFAYFSTYNPVKEFEFTAVAGLPMTSADTYASNIKQFRNAVVTRFSATAASNITEAQVAAYIAEMTANNRYNAALDNVPAAFKNSNKKSYLTAPYFGNLASNSTSLTMHFDRNDTMIKNAIAAKDLEIFTLDDLVAQIRIEKNNSLIASLLSFPSEMEEFAPTISQASGIIYVYANIKKSLPAFAKKIEPVISECIHTIALGCELSEENVLTLSENGIPVSKEQNLLTGYALLCLSKADGNRENADMAYMLMNQQLEDIASLEYKTIAKLYPILIPENRYYPHAELLGFYGETCTWAWTCSPSITYVPTNTGIVNINIDFQLNSTKNNAHYIIFCNIPDFNMQIEIQNLMFRSAKDFEIYNSSGYVYNSETQTMLLKSRHKSRNELIRLFCKPATNFVPADKN